jgi:hypothetical protein
MGERNYHSLLLVEGESVLKNHSQDFHCFCFNEVHLLIKFLDAGLADHRLLLCRVNKAQAKHLNEDGGVGVRSSEVQVAEVVI